MLLLEESADLQNLITDTPDKQYFKCYKFLISSRFGDVRDRYSKAFGLCTLLDVEYIYDIGCGCGYQSLLLYPHDIKYIGVDINKCDCKRNRNSWHDNYSFIEAKYPCTLKPEPNNIAILFYSMSDVRKYVNIYLAAGHLEIDFGRIIITVSKDLLGSWEHCLSKYYTVISLGKSKLEELPIIFATKFEDDINILKSVNYKYDDYDFTVDS